MSKSPQRKLAQEIRGLVLRAVALRETHGIYADARHAAGPQKTPQMLHRLAKKIADNAPITINERIFLSHLLKALAEGFDVRKQLRIIAKKVGHKPSQAVLNAEIVRELEQREADDQRQPVAFAEVALLVGKTAYGVEQIWKRRSGRRKGRWGTIAKQKGRTATK